LVAYYYCSDATIAAFATTTTNLIVSISFAQSSWCRAIFVYYVGVCVRALVLARAPAAGGTTDCSLCSSTYTS